MEIKLNCAPIQGTVRIGINWFLHTLLWNGKAETVADLPFPLNVAATLLEKEVEVEIEKSAAYQTDFDDDSLGLFFDESKRPEEKLATQSLGRISLNGLINWLLDPENAAFNLLLSLFFVGS